MTSNVKIQGFSFYINTPTEYNGVPTVKNITSNLDLISDLIGINRLTGETASEFKQRMLDVSVHQESSVYDGVVNGVTRAFGYTREKAIQITLKQSSSGENIARNPRVDVLANKVVLYSDHRPDGTTVVDKTIRTYQSDDSGYYLSDLVAEINSSQCFSATIYSGIRPNIFSTNLIQGTSDLFIQGDPLRSDLLTYLSAQNIIEGSIIYPNDRQFNTEVTGTPSSDGEYRLDRLNGKLYHYSVPSDGIGVDYHAAIFPFDVDYSPIKIYTLQDDNFQHELFDHATLDSEEEVNTLPNDEGSEIYQQLFLEADMFWGE